MILARTIKQIVSYKSVGHELEDFLSDIQYQHGFKVMSIFETKVTSTEQGFIVIYDTCDDKEKVDKMIAIKRETTNGDIIQKMFPDCTIMMGTSIIDVQFEGNKQDVEFTYEWWDTPYGNKYQL